MRFTLVLWLTLTAASALAQIPEKFTNLEVLPKDISRQELTGIMRGFSLSLGLRCENCHVGGPDLNTMDFKADTKETKQTARKMMRMVAAVNKENNLKVECVTCHRGLNKPRTIQAVLTEELEKKDLASALALYRDLRKKYYGGAQYDFTEAALNQLTETLQGQRKIKEAVAIMEMNAELNKLTGWGNSLLAMSHRANGEIDKAIADFTRIVEVNPNDQWAKKQLEDLKAGKK